MSQFHEEEIVRGSPTVDCFACLGKTEALLLSLVLYNHLISHSPTAQRLDIALYAPHFSPYRPFFSMGANMTEVFSRAA